jgi:large subunit ribosomal protein L3
MGDVKGIVGEKLGMTQIFVETRAVPVTVLKAGPCVVAQVRTSDVDGYDAGPARVRTDSAPRRQSGRARATSTRRAPNRCGISSSSGPTTLRRYTPGQQVTAEMFSAGDLVDVVGVSKGKGFSGVMKRHGFAGSPRLARCGAQAPRARFDRCVRDAPPASSRGCRWPARTGNQRVTVLNLEVVRSIRSAASCSCAVPCPDRTAGS